MKTLLSSAITLSTLAGAAYAQPGSPPVYVSGLPHTATGNALLGTPEGRRLPVHNLGSSGQDGVEVNLHSAAGGGVSVDVGPLLATAGSEIKIRHKGWDGLIYGNHRVISHGDGTGAFEWNFPGAATVNIKVLDDNGAVISDENLPGPIVAKPWVPNFTCPNGGTPYLTYRVVRLCNTCPEITVYGWACVGSAGDDDDFYSSSRVIVTPTTGPGTPTPPPIDSAILSTIGLPSLTVAGASIETLGVPAWGVGQAHIGEVCDDTNGDGSCDERRLPVTNIGSSGQDGVSLDLGPDAGGFNLQLSRGNCCRGHVTLMKAYDDTGSEERLILTQQDPTPLGPEQTIDADFSSRGASGFVLTCYDITGAVIGSPQAVPNGGTKPRDTGMCPGSDEVWDYDHILGKWVFLGCLGESTQRITFGNGLVYDGVATFSVSPLNPTIPAASSKIRHVVITKNGTEMELKRVIVRPPAPPAPATCEPDFNGDGDIGTDQDIEAFFACLGGNCCPTCGSPDFNGDGDVGTDQDIESFFRVLGGGPC